MRQLYFAIIASLFIPTVGLSQSLGVVDVTTVDGAVVAVSGEEIKRAHLEILNKLDAIWADNIDYNGDGSVTIYGPKFLYQGKYHPLLFCNRDSCPDFQERRNQICKLFEYSRYILGSTKFESSGVLLDANRLVDDFEPGGAGGFVGAFKSVTCVN